MSDVPTAAGVAFVPTVQGQPAFATVQAVPLNPEWEKNSALTPDLWGVFQGSSKLTVRQHVKVLPKHCCSCPPCVKQENTYSIYAGLGQDAEQEFLRIDEVSDDWNRCCCSPYHPLKLEVRQYIPVPGDGARTNYDHLTADLQRDFAGFGATDKQKKLEEMYKQQPVLMTMVRDDGMRCCGKCPCKWLDTFVCFTCCQDGMHLYAGATAEHPDGKELGRPYDKENPNLIGSAIQPVFGGWCTPTVEIREGADDTTPFAKMQGPCCFGGWSELCCDFMFYTSKYDSPHKTGDLAYNVKKKPSGLASGLREFFTEADVYSIEFKENANLTAAQKASILTGQLLFDYMLFEGNTEKCSQDDQNIYCYCFYCSVMGYLWPCYITIPKNQG